MNIISTTYFILLCFGCFFFLGVFLFFFLYSIKYETVYQTDQKSLFQNTTRGRNGEGKGMMDSSLPSFVRSFVCLFIHSFVIGVLG